MSRDEEGPAAPNHPPGQAGRPTHHRAPLDWPAIWHGAAYWALAVTVVGVFIAYVLTGIRLADAAILFRQH